jgi:hypothetical protein
VKAIIWPHTAQALVGTLSFFNRTILLFGSAIKGFCDLTASSFQAHTRPGSAETSAGIGQSLLLIQFTPTRSRGILHARFAASKNLQN